MQGLGARMALPRHSGRWRFAGLGAADERRAAAGFDQPVAGEPGVVPADRRVARGGAVLFAAPVCRRWRA